MPENDKHSGSGSGIRSRSPRSKEPATAGAPPGLGDTVSKTELRSAIKEVKTDLLAQILAANESSNKLMFTTITEAQTANAVTLAGIMQANQDQNEARMDAFDQDLQNHNDLFKSYKTDWEEMRKEMADLRARVGMAETNTVDTKILSDDLYNRAVDKGILVITTMGGDLVTKDSVLESVTEWLTDAGVADAAWSIKSKEKEKRFVVRFKGAAIIAAGLAQRATHALKQDGEWRNLQATNSDGNRIRLFINPDKNPHQNKVEISTRRLRGILAAEPGFEDTRIFANLKDGQLFVNYIPIAEIKCSDSEKDTVVRWNPKGLQKLPTFDRFALVEKLNLKKADKIEWQV